MALPGAQTVRAITYSNLIFSGSGAKTVATGTSVAGNLSIAPTGTATASINNGLNIPVGSLTLGGLGRINGTWGSTSSAATNQNDTYFAATTGIVTVSTDTRATPTVTAWPTASGITYGQALSASTLTGGTASVTGSFAFTTPSTVPPAGTYSASVTFTPTDLTSYKNRSRQRKCCSRPSPSRHHRRIIRARRMVRPSPLQARSSRTGAGQLVNGDTVTGVTLTSAGAAASLR